MQQLYRQSIHHQHQLLQARGPSLASTSGRPCARPAGDSRRSLRCYSYTTGSSSLESHPVKRAFLSIGVSPNDLERAARLEPSVLAVDKLDRLHGMIDLLLGASLSPSDIGQVLLAYPQAFQLSLDRAREVLDFLRDDMHLSESQVRTVLTRYPSILNMNVKGQLRPQVAYLNSLGVGPESLPELVLSRPLVLGPGIDTVITFLKRLGVPRSQMHRMLRSCPLDYRVQFKSFSAAAPGGSSSSSSSGGMGRN
eukprot:XP_001693924.1 mitochondrial transcription termination factor [Chlamydomonas reinhardtii]